MQANIIAFDLLNIKLALYYQGKYNITHWNFILLISWKINPLEQIETKGAKHVNDLRNKGRK